MSKQSSLFNFMPRGEKDTAKTMNSNNVSAPMKTSKFKFTKPTSRLQLQTNTNENRTLNTIGNTTNGASTVKKSDECFIISDDEPSPVKNVTAPGKKVTAPVKTVMAPVKSVPASRTLDDSFEDFKSNDWTFTRASTLAKNETQTIEDLYAKYGSPKSSDKSKFDSIDIDQALNSNASYVNAMKKLDENMEQLKTSPPKKVTTGKFKFNMRSKPANVTNTTQISVSKSTSSFSSSSFASSSASSASNQTATLTSDVYSSSVLNTYSSSISNSSSSVSNPTVNKFSPVNTPRIFTTPTDASTSQSSSGSYKPDMASVSSPTESSFKSAESP